MSDGYQKVVIKWLYKYQSTIKNQISIF